MAYLLTFSGKGTFAVLTKAKIRPFAFVIFFLGLNLQAEKLRLKPLLPRIAEAILLDAI